MKPIRLGEKRTPRTSALFGITFCFGGVGYGLIEVIWRGYTHPTMLVTGGLCFTVICLINRNLVRIPLLFRGMLCALFVTATEFFVGILVNRILYLDVWDYSHTRFNLLGQICLEYAFFWFLLCTVLSLGVGMLFRRKRL